MKAFFSEKYYVPGRYPYPLNKPELVMQAMKKTGLPLMVEEPEKISDKDVLRVHTPEYFEAFKKGVPRTLAESSDMAWSPALVDAFLLKTGGTYQAARTALDEKVSANIGGGFHHAIDRRGLCFCPINDLAITVKKLQAEGGVEKVLVADCDLHYGNGTDSIFRNDDSVFTFSLYGQDISALPRGNTKTSKTIKLAAGSGSEAYFKHLNENLPGIIAGFKPNLILYNAGADPFEGDKLSNLKMSLEDMAERDRIIFQMAKDVQVPIAYTLSGGYGDRKGDLSKTIEVHTNTFVKAAEVFRIK